MKEVPDSYLVFTYGTLKTDEPNHNIMLNRDCSRFCELICRGQTETQYPLVIASSFNVPFLLDRPGTGNFIEGEIWRVNHPMLLWLDAFEDVPRYYQRRVERILPLSTTHESSPFGPEQVLECHVYFLQNYATDLLRYPTFNNYSSLGPHNRPYIRGDSVEKAREVTALPPDVFKQLYEENSRSAV